MIGDEMIGDEMIGDETVRDETDWGRNGLGTKRMGDETTINLIHTYFSVYERFAIKVQTITAKGVKPT